MTKQRSHDATISSSQTVLCNIVMTGPMSLEIVPECTSLPFLAIFSAGIIAFPTQIRRKFQGILLGVIGLSLLNVIRMFCILLVGMFIPSVFDSAHVLVGQSLMIVATVALWLFWLYSACITTLLFGFKIAGWSTSIHSSVRSCLPVIYDNLISNDSRMSS